jgi:hypothetical protein
MRLPSPLTFLLTTVAVAGLCNASPHLIRRNQLPAARVVEAAAIEIGSSRLNTSLAMNVTTGESASVAYTTPTATNPPTSSSACLPIMMQVDYLDCGKRKG